MSEKYRSDAVGSGKYRVPESTPRKRGSTVRLLILLLVLILLAGGAVGIYLLSSEKPFATYGDTDSANVRELQHWLAQLGYYDGSVTGDFDDATYDAYWGYCTAHGLTANRSRDGGLIVSQEDFEAITACTAVPTATPSPEIIAAHVPANNFTIATYDNDTCVITDYNGTDTDLSIPDSLNGYLVTAIGSYAFFYGDSLTSVTIPASVTFIGDNIFASCNALTSISVSKNNPYYYVHNNALISNAGILVSYPAGSTAATYTIPDSVTAIGANAFCECAYLTSVTVPGSVAFIGADAFYACAYLTSVTVPDSVAFIGADAFAGCPNLTLQVPANSYAEQYAIENNIPYTTY